MRLILGLLALLACAMPAQADGFDLPGLAGDAARYQEELRRKLPPAGLAAPARAAAEQRARAAEQKGDWTAAAAAWEERLGGAGDAGPELWLALARAQLARTPPAATRALEAGWIAFQAAPPAAGEIPALLIIAEAVQKLGRPAQQQAALAAVVERAPAETRYQQMLTEARRAAGLLVAGVTTEPEAEPARACLRFTIPPSRRTDWQPGDWVRAEPPVQGLTVLRDGEQICVAGLPHGRTTRLILRAGLPGEDNLRLMAESAQAVAMPNRDPRIAFDANRFLLPRGQAPQLGVTTVNIGTLALKVVKVSERNLARFGRQAWTVGEPLTGYAATDVAESWGATIWSGRVELPPLVPNRQTRSVIPLPEGLAAAGPGMYVLLASPGDGTRADAVALPVLVTDLGLTAWRGREGLAAQLRALGTGRPIAGVRLRLLANGNDILAEASTDADGIVRFAGPLLRGTGPMAPRAVLAERGDDLVALDLDAAAFDLSDRGAGGLPNAGPLDAYTWLDRGIYRPGETVQAMVLLRDAAGAPQDVPARLRVKRPNGSLFAETVPARGPGAALHWAIPLDRGATAGLWTLEILADPAAPPIGTTRFRVDAFVPERLEVKAGPPPAPLAIGQPLAVPIEARFLYGAPAAGLGGQASLRLRTDRAPYPAFKDYLFGLADEEFAPDLLSFDIPALDANGKGAVTLSLPRAPDTTRPLTGALEVRIDEPGGRASRTEIALPLRPAGMQIGIRPRFPDGAVNANTEAGFDIIALDPENRPVAAKLRARLVRERPDWRMVIRNSAARYETVWRDEPVDSTELTLATTRPTGFARTLPFGRYRLEVSEPAGLAITSVRFRAGWAESVAAEVPDKVDLAADKPRYLPGERARLRITPPFAGPASLAILTDRLVTIRDLDLPASGAEVEVPIDPAWGAGAHIAVTVYRPGEARDGVPARALGLVWLQLDPAPRQMAVSIDAPAQIRPNRRLEVPIRVTNAGPQAQVTLAAVDEGILRLTRFASPDPLAYFMGRRALGVDIRDDYGRLIPPPEGVLATLRQGGDGFLPGAIDIPQRTVALFSGPVALGADGSATIALDIPDFAGELRLMAVAWAGEKLGSANRPLTVRDPVIAEALLPRFLAPGDEARLPVLLHNLDLPAGEVTATLTASGAIELAGAARLAATLAPQARALPASAIRALGTGEGVLRLAVSGPNGFSATRESRITVRSSRAPVNEASAVEIAPGAEARLTPATAAFVPGSWRATARLGGPVRYDAAGLQRLLEAYPFGCLEQTGAQLLALAAFPADAAMPAEQAGRLQQAVQAVLGKQRFDGGFGLWSAQDAAEPWLGSFAVEGLLRARAAGAVLPPAALDAALARLAEDAEASEPDSTEERAAQAYRLYVLSLGGQPRLGAARRLLEQLDDLPTPLAKAQLGAAFARASDTARAERALGAALGGPARQRWGYDYGSPTRDAFAVTLLLAESGVLADRLAAQRGRLPGADLNINLLSTQDQAWGVALAGGLGRTGQPVRIATGGRELAGVAVTLPLTGSTTVRNLGTAPVTALLSVGGIPAQPLPAGRDSMRIGRRFLDLAGQPLNLDTLKQNQVFVLQLLGRGELGEAQRTLIQQGLPAGLETMGALPAGDVPGMPWLGKLSTTAAVPALDDRVAAAVDITAEAPEIRVAFTIRVVTAGNFELPGAQVEDMQRPSVYARQNGARLAIAPAD